MQIRVTVVLCPLAWSRQTGPHYLSGSSFWKDQMTMRGTELRNMCRISWGAKSFHWMLPEYVASRITKVPVHNVLMDLPGNVQALFLNDNCRVEEVTPLRGEIGTVIGDYSFLLCLIREGFQASPDSIQFKNQYSIVVKRARDFIADYADSKAT